MGVESQREERDRMFARAQRRSAPGFSGRHESEAPVVKRPAGTIVQAEMDPVGVLPFFHVQAFNEYLVVTGGGGGRTINDWDSPDVAGSAADWAWDGAVLIVPPGVYVTALGGKWATHAANFAAGNILRMGLALDTVFTNIPMSEYEVRTATATWHMTAAGSVYVDEDTEFTFDVFQNSGADKYVQGHHWSVVQHIAL